MEFGTARGACGVARRGAARVDRQAFFTRDGERLVPSDCARGPWTAGSLHGRVVIGLLGAEIERRHGDDAYLPARLTVDLYRAPSMAPLEVVTKVVRDGHRIRVIDAELISEGKSAARASCQLLRRTANPPGEVWSAPDWDAPAPEALEDLGDVANTMGGMWGLRRISGRIGQAEQRRAWMREVRPLVAGEALTPFVRVATSCDYASPLANAGDNGLGFINSDLTLYLHRLPAGEWIGFESTTHGATDGVAVGHCNLYDQAGRIGWASACALAQSKVPTGKVPTS
jgi:hypothetical protein